MEDKFFSNLFLLQKDIASNPRFNQNQPKIKGGRRTITVAPDRKIISQTISSYSVFYKFASTIIIIVVIIINMIVIINLLYFKGNYIKAKATVIEPGTGKGVR